MSTRLPGSIAPSVRPMSEGTMLSMLPSPESSKFGLIRRRFVVQSSRSRPPISGTCQSSRLEPPERPRREFFRPLNLLLLRRVAADADADDGLALHHVERPGEAVAAPDRGVADAGDAYGLRLTLVTRLGRGELFVADIGEVLLPESARIAADEVDGDRVGEARHRVEALRDLHRAVAAFLELRRFEARALHCRDVARRED